MLNSKIEFILNNKIISISDLDTNTTVLNFLRNEKNLTGTKEGCASGDCGACTAVVGELKNNKIEYKSINACITFLYTLNGKQLVTVEHLANGSLHPVQKAMIESDGSQCGFCTPGIVMSMYCMYENKVKPTHENIDRYLSGNLCRCTGYNPIKKSIKNMYSYKRNNHDYKKILKLLKGIKKNDIMIENKQSKFYVHHNLKGLIKDYQNKKDTHLLVGGTDLALEVTKKRNNLRNIFYLGANEDLNFIKIEKKRIIIGSATPISEIIPKLNKYYPTFSKMFERYGSEQIRNSASLGGNLGSASPIGDSLPVLIALNSEIVIQGKKARSVFLDDYFISYRKTKLKKNEFIKEIIIPINKKNILKCYKISKRIDDDISSVFMAINANIKNDIFKSLKIVCGGMAEIPKIATQTQNFLINKKFNKENINEAKNIIVQEFNPINDMRASKEYRSKISQNLLERFLLEKDNINTLVY